MTPQTPPPDGRPYAVSRAIVTFEFYATAAEAQAEFDSIVDDENALQPSESGVEIAAWDYTSGEWVQTTTTPFPPRPTP